MKKETKNKVISYSIIAAVGLLISFVFLRLRSFNAVTLPAERYRLLADAFTIPGIAFMMFGALIWVAGLGALDGISFAVKGLLRRLIPGSRLNSEDNESYYEYIQKKRAKKTKAYLPDAFLSDCNKLNIRIPDVVEPATNCIPEFINMVSVLLEKGYAYIAGDNVYFDTSKLKDYYVFSSQSEKELMVGVRDDVSEDTNKRNKADFVLWFTKSKFDNQELKWDSPWGVGYPGWHIECSCISMKHLGEYMDIHCGGVDNIFPHHTNEIAQSEAYLGHKWCNYWFHVHHLNDKTGKMSKSTGNILTVSVLQEKGYDPLVYRMFCLQSHYRKPLEFSYEIMDNVAAAYNKLVKKIGSLKDEGEVDKEVYNKFRESFIDALANDINTSSALTVVYDVLRADCNDRTKLELVKSFDEVLSLNLTRECGKAAATADVDDELSQYVLAKIEERKAAKKEKNFAKADAIREELLSRGIVIKDTREGTVWEKA